MHNQRYGDDVALISDNLGDLETILKGLSEQWKEIGLKINIEKTNIPTAPNLE